MEKCRTGIIKRGTNLPVLLEGAAFLARHFRLEEELVGQKGKPVHADDLEEESLLCLLKFSGPLIPFDTDPGIKFISKLHLYGSFALIRSFCRIMHQSYCPHLRMRQVLLITAMLINKRILILYGFVFLTLIPLSIRLDCLSSFAQFSNNYNL